MITDLIKLWIRKKRPVVFMEKSRVKPVSPVFGLDRGTPIDRYYIEQFLQANAGLIRGRVLEVGDNHYSRLFGSRDMESCDVLLTTTGSQTSTIVGDLTDCTTLPENTYDCFICTQTFNFIYDVQRAVTGACHLLKPGGALIATVAGISQISRYDMDRWGDFWRFTTASLTRLFEPVFPVSLEIGSYGNVLAACAFLQGVAVEDIPDTTLLDVPDPDYQLLLTILARKEV